MNDKPIDITIDTPDKPTEGVAEWKIYINARLILWHTETISFDQVVEQWNQLDPDRHVIEGLPGINWKTPKGTTGTLYRKDDPLKVVFEMEFMIDPSYLA